MGKRGQSYLIGNQAFKDSQIAICLQKLNCRVIWESNITDYDFSPAPGSYIRIATESDIVMRNLDEWEMDLKAMKKFEKPVLLIEKNPTTSSIFPKLQFVVCVKLGINVIPVKGPLEIARYLNRFVTQDVKPPRPMPVSAGTFNNGNRPKTTEEALVRSVQCFPGLGEVKAMALIKALRSK
ncbi:hypothetical protein BKA69DRAFT_661742 [Paraphysoderma sedebokerense]|nr:hypothetical protein BKA69DRAFT_661742 [Paraphysoderma sedebokerense]